MVVLFWLGAALFALAIFTFVKPQPRIGLGSTRNSMIAGGLGMLFLIFGASGYGSQGTPANDEVQVIKPAEQADVAPPRTPEQAAAQSAYDILDGQLAVCELAFEAYETTLQGEETDQTTYAAYSAAAKAKEQCGEVHERLVHRLSYESPTIQAAFRDTIGVTCRDSVAASNKAWTLAMQVLDGDVAPSRVHAAKEAYADGKASMSLCAMGLSSVGEKLGATTNDRARF